MSPGRVRAKGVGTSRLTTLSGLATRSRPATSPMTHSHARALCASSRKRIGVAALSGAERVTRLAQRHGTSRKFVRAQRELARQAVDLAFAEPTAPSLVEPFPRVSDAWVRRFVLGVVLIVHGSYHQVIELLRDLFGLSLCVGTIHTWVVEAAQRAAGINRGQDLSRVRVGLHDEIFQGNQPVLAGIDAASTYCYLLQGVEQRDADTWGVHLLDAAKQGLDPDYTVADAGTGLRAGQVAAWGDKPCHGDVFHVRQQCEALANVLTRLANECASRREALELEMRAAKDGGDGRQLSARLGRARQAEVQARHLATDVKTLTGWLGHDVLSLAGPQLKERREAVAPARGACCPPDSPAARGPATPARRRAGIRESARRQARGYRTAAPDAALLGPASVPLAPQEADVDGLLAALE